MSFFRKKTVEELRAEIEQLNARKIEKEEYKALLQKRNELKWGKLVAGLTPEEKEARKVKFKTVLDKLGKLSEANAEYGLDMGESKKKVLPVASKGLSRSRKEPDFDALAEDVEFFGTELISSKVKKKSGRGVVS